MIQIILLILFTLFTPGLKVPGEQEESSIPQKILFGTDAHWPPYIFLTEEGKISGFTVDLLSEIFERDNKSIEFRITPWSRVLYELETGLTHIVADLSSNKERRTKYFFSDPLYKLNHALYFKKERYGDSPLIEELGDLNDYKIGGIKGYNLNIYGIDPQLIDQTALDPQALFGQLKLNRFDLAIGYVEIYNNMAMNGRLHMDDFGHIPIPGFQPVNYYSIVLQDSPEGKELVEMINKGMEILKKNGTYKNLLRKYGLNES